MSTSVFQLSPFSLEKFLYRASLYDCSTLGSALSTGRFYVHPCSETHMPILFIFSCWPPNMFTRRHPELKCMQFCIFCVPTKKISMLPGLSVRPNKTKQWTKNGGQQHLQRTIVAHSKSYIMHLAQHTIRTPNMWGFATSFSSFVSALQWDIFLREYWRKIFGFVFLNDIGRRI